MQLPLDDNFVCVPYCALKRTVRKPGVLHLALH